MDHATTHSASVPSDREMQLGREAVFTLKNDYADEVRIYKDRGRICTREIHYSNTRWASSGK